MALLKVASSSVARTQFTIWSQEAGSGGAVYTVPSGKSFTGYMLLKTPFNTIAMYFLINGVQFEFTANTTYGEQRYFPIYLGSGDVIQNYSTSWFGLTGYEE